MVLRKLVKTKRKLQSNKNTPESLEISSAVSNGVKKAVEKAIHDTNVKVPK